MTWITTIAFEQAQGKLKKLYQRVTGPGNNVDNIMLAHSLRPHTMQGHMALYKSVLHHNANQLPKWVLEAIGVYVSQLNKCDYCVEHHSQGLRRLINDEPKSGEILKGLGEDKPAQVFDAKYAPIFTYAKALTLNPASMQAEFVESMRSAGWSDGEVLEVNQVTAYFNYANRTVLGLGVTTAGDILGLSPGDNNDENNWQHQ